MFELSPLAPAALHVANLDGNGYNQAMKSYIYKVVIEKEEDGRSSVYCPALPGCNSWGHTEEEALANIGDAIRLYLKELTASGHPIPIDVEVIDETVVSIAV